MSRFLGYAWGPAPSTRQHRLPAAWLAQYLYTTPHDLEEGGVAIQVVRLSEEMLEWLQGWDGVAVRSSGPEIQHLKREELRSLIVRPTMTLLGHEEGRLPSAVEQDEFKTPPRPQLGSAAEEIVTLPSEDEQTETLPPADELYGMYEQERLRTQDSASAVALLASAYGCSPDQVRSKVLSGLDRSVSSFPSGSDEVKPRDESHLPPSLLTRPPPGLELFPAEVSPQIASQLVAPSLSGKPNPLLGLSSGTVSATAARSLAASLFPQSGVNTDRRHLWSGLSNKAGAAYGEAFGSSADPASAATDRIIHAIDGIRRSQEAEKTGTKGTLSSIQEGEKLDVFLARGCGELTVELCQGVYGKELFHSIKRAGHHAKHSLILMKWPVCITNRLALSIAGLWWGGKESHTLLASDCATVRTDQLETWTPPSDHKIEAHPRPPASFLVWLRYAENQVRVFEAAYGIEHMSERLAFLKALHEAHDENEHAYPVQYCIDLFEELNAVWAESVRESRRVLCAKLGTENPRLEDLKLIALAPGEGDRPNFQFARVWDLQDPASYYQAVVVARQERALNRMLHKQLHDVSAKEKKRKTAGPEVHEEVPPSDPKSGAAPLLAPARPPEPPFSYSYGKGDGKRKAGEQPSKAKFVGKRLAPAEVKRSVSHAPIDPKSKLPICWDAACHIGCFRSPCPHSHEPLPPLSRLPRGSPKWSKSQSKGC